MPNARARAAPSFESDGAVVKYSSEKQNTSSGCYFNLRHAIEHTANQNIETSKYVRLLYITPSNRALRV